MSGHSHKVSHRARLLIMGFNGGRPYTFGFGA